MSCGTCRWHDDYTWACFNGHSPNCADFTDPEDRCSEWEPTTEVADSHAAVLETGLPKCTEHK